MLAASTAASPRPRPPVRIVRVREGRAGPTKPRKLRGSASSRAGTTWSGARAAPREMRLQAPRLFRARRCQGCQAPPGKFEAPQVRTTVEDVQQRVRDLMKMADAVLPLEEDNQG